MTAAWLWLAAAVLTQWACIAALRASQGLRRLGWAALTYATMIASVGCVAVALTHGLTIAVAYGIWTGAGVALAAVTGVVVFGDRLDRAQTGGLLLVLVGVVLLQVSGAHR